MRKIAFIGAGSFGFTRGLVKDLVAFPLLEDAHIALMDIDRERLEFSKLACQRIIREGKRPAKLTATLNRKKALEGADAVVCTILAGDVGVWRYDIEIPKKFGVDFNVGDTRGAAGIFRALRTIPILLDICADIEKLCPNAMFLNYTNPMAMNCRAMQKTFPDLRISGLCHSVQGTAMMLAGWIGAPMDEVTYVCGGINHQAWYLRFEWNHEDAYPLIREAMKRRSVWKHELVRNEMFKHLGYYVTESCGHNSEYSWWFRKRPDLIEKYCTHSTGWNPGEHAYVLNSYKRRARTWKKSVRDWINDKKPLDLSKGHEYASSIINAYVGGEIFEFNGNVPNKGLIDNLPRDCCVEVPVYADRRGLSPTPVGALPPQLAALNNINVAAEEMAVEAALTGNPERAFHAVAYSPLTASVLSLAEIKQMVNAMFRKSKDHLPQFKHTKA